VPNDAQGVDPQALLDHMIQERKIPLTGPDDRAQLQRIADEAVAREQPDFSADDQQITDAVAARFGSLTSVIMLATWTAPIIAGQLRPTSGIPQA